MAHIRQFAGIRYAPAGRFDMSNVIAPPYDVLDDAGKARFVAKDPHNIVNIDLPFMPPKSVGPDAVYEKSAITMQSWLDSGVLHRDTKGALYPYQQSYDHNGKTYHRRGFFTLVRLSPFGQGQVVPHEKTYKGPIEDRLKLMRATGAQLSPIFGVFSDTHGEVNKILYANVGKPELDATMDGVRNQLWKVIDSDAENKVIEFLGTKPVYIADGHHRYTTALQYQADAIAANGGQTLPESHPANWCMFVLVSMQDDGLLILPTHRLIGGLKDFSVDAFKKSIAANFEVIETPLSGEQVKRYVDTVLPVQPAHTFGIYDGASKKVYQLNCKNPDVLARLETGQSEAWRRLDVAILQRYFLEEVLQPQFTDGTGELTRGYTAYGSEIAPRVNGSEFQIGLLLKATPLGALEQLARHNEVMPQKSTFFVPKIATGMMINPLR